MLSLAAGLAGCSALQQLASREPASSATGTPNDAEPVPDPLHPTTHQPGDSFEVGGARVTYLGTFQVNGKLEVRLRVESGHLASDARIATPDGQPLSLSGSGATLTSEPFGDAAAPPPGDATLTLVVGDVLVPLEVGAIK